jgi:hypothetical protein
MAMPPSRDLRCPRCGAPLDWDGSALRVTCDYCQTAVPMHVPAVAAPVAPVAPVAPARPRQRGLPLGYVLPALVLVSALLIALIANVVGRREQRLGPGEAAGVTVADIHKIDLATTPEQLAKRLGVKSEDNAVRATLRDAPFVTIHFNWNRSHLEHVCTVSLDPPKSGIAAGVIERVQAQLGRALRRSDDGRYRLMNAQTTLEIGNSVYANVRVGEDPRWKARMVALFTVLKGAALGTNDLLDERTKRDVLNLDYPITRIGEIDIDVTVDGAEREVRRVTPGATSQAARHEVGIGHPWVATTTLYWQNVERGKFDRLYLFFAPEFAFKAQREEVQRCLTPLLGAPEVHTTDHLAGQVALGYESNPKLPAVFVNDTAMMITPTKRPDAKASLKRVLDTVAACR